MTRASSPAGAAPRRGRRPGAPDTRAAILAAARASFAASGYAGTTMRAVAGAAGVDPALVHHYFGTKDDLFLAALELPLDPRVATLPVVEGGLDGAGERLMELFVSVWDDPPTRLPLLALVRSVIDPAGAQIVRDGFVRMVMLPVGRALGVEPLERRMTLVASQLLGLVMVRYLLELEPLASAPSAQVVATYAPVIQGYLTAPLP